ncbi:FecR family protein [Steroidobacter sp.]|uniref:FecR family protein n=1 Tax=Steroidobacter sp. TaxID=1978227 RepID=UPI001A482EBC|nr:FecR domain-containing protein [Steroidobacter sp.]MBL8268484.1 FecR domain-containing protein [Steroidobacter sp.]
MNNQVFEEACTWFVELRTGDIDAAGRKQFDSWIRRSPEHLRAYLEITELWQDATAVEFGQVDDMDALLDSARADDNVIPFELEQHPRVREAQNVAPAAVVARPRSFSLAIAASVAIAAVGTAFFAWQQFYGTQRYSTSIGEQRLIVLDDGSSVKLNTRSSIKIHFSEHERAVELSEGQALFVVAKDANRPFTVRSGEVQVRAVGTQFDVYRRSAGTTVTVVEGQVVVAAGGEPSVEPQPAAHAPALRAQQLAGATLLSAGQQVITTADQPLQPQTASVDAATAWTQQKMVFQSVPLPEVAAEFNRYNKKQLIVSDPQLAEFRVSGVYSSTEPSLLLQFLRQQPGIDIAESDSIITITNSK